MLDADAHPHAAASGSNSRINARRRSADNVDPFRDLEFEGLVGETGVLAIVAEGERRPAALHVGGGERADLQRLAIDDEDEPVVVALLALRVELERVRLGVVR